MLLATFQRSFLQRQYQQRQRAAGGSGACTCGCQCTHPSIHPILTKALAWPQPVAASGSEESKHGIFVAVPYTPHLRLQNAHLRLNMLAMRCPGVGGGGGGAARSRTRKRRRGGVQVTRWLTSTSGVATLSMPKTKSSPNTTSPRAWYRPVGVRGEGRKLMFQQGQSRLATRTLFTAAQQAPMQAEALCTQPSRLAGPALHATTCTLKIPVQGKLTRAGQAGRR